MTLQGNTVEVLAITADHVLRKITVAGGEEGIRAAIGCSGLSRFDIRHGVAIWFDRHHSDPSRRPNMAAVCLMTNCSDADPQTMPIPNDVIVLTGTDSATGRPRTLRPDQYRALAYTLYGSEVA